MMMMIHDDESLLMKDGWMDESSMAGPDLLGGLVSHCTLLGGLIPET